MQVDQKSARNRQEPSSSDYASVRDFSQKPTRIQIGLWAVLLVVAILVSVGNFGAYEFGTHFDDSQYAILARSLVFADHFGMMNVPGQVATGKYPFGFPLLLVPFVLLSPDNFQLLQIPSLIATILNATMLFWGWGQLGRGQSHWWGLAITALYVLSPLSIDHSRRVMSEPIFTTCCLLALWLAEQAALRKPGRWWTVAMSTALLFGLFSRTIGVILVAAVFVYLFLRRRSEFCKPALLIAAQMILFTGLIVAVSPVGLGDLWPSEYFRDPSAALITAPSLDRLTAAPENQQAPVNQTFLYRLERYLGKEVRNVALPLGGGQDEVRFAQSIGLPSLPLLVECLVSALVLVGIFRFLQKYGLSALIVFAVFYFAAIFQWIWDDTRFLYPIQAQIYLGLLLGVESVLVGLGSMFYQKSPQPRLLARAVALVVLVLALLSLYKSINIDNSRVHAGDPQARTAWLKEYSSPSDVVMTEAPETDYLYGGNKTVFYPPSSLTARQVEDYLSEKNINYILVAPKIEWQPVFKPTYSGRTIAFLPLLNSLVSDHKLALVYASEKDWIQVFKREPQ